MSVTVCVCVCVCVCVYVCVHAYLCTCMCVCMCMSAYACMWMCVCVCVRVHACMHACVYVCMFVCMHYVYVRIHVCECVSIWVCAYWQDTWYSDRLTSHRKVADCCNFQQAKSTQQSKLWLCAGVWGADRGSHRPRDDHLPVRVPCGYVSPVTVSPYTVSLKDVYKLWRDDNLDKWPNRETKRSTSAVLHKKAGKKDWFIDRF